MVLCIRPSLAIGIHRGTLACIRWDIRLECARGERPARGRRQSCRHATAMCMCVWLRYADLILVGFSKSDYMLRPFAELVTCTHIISCFPTIVVLRSMQL